MALDKKQIVHFKRMLKEAQKKPRFFAYIQEGKDGEPVLILDKKMSIVSKEGREARKEAQKKVMVLGEIKPINSREWAFVAPDPKKGKLPRSLKQVFGKDVPQLKKCQCLTEEEYQAMMAPTAAGSGTDNATSGDNGGSKDLEKKMTRAVRQLESDPTSLSDKDLKQLGTSLKAYQGDTDFTAAIALVKKTKSLRKGAKEIEQKVEGFAEMRKDVIQRFKAIKGTDAKALKSQETIISEVKDYIADLKRLKAKYEKLLAA